MKFVSFENGRMTNNSARALYVAPLRGMILVAILLAPGCQQPRITPTPLPVAEATTERSVKQFTTCDGSSDDTTGFARALAAASHGAFALVIDCSVTLKIGKDIAHTQFIDDGTTIEFKGIGKISVDNVFVPAFTIAGSKNVTLLNWNVEYKGSIPVDWDVGGYSEAGKQIETKGYAQPAFAFNGRRLTKWLSDNRGIVFDSSLGSVFSQWYGPTNTSAVFYLIGEVSEFKVSGMKLYVAKDADGSSYAPMVFSLQQNWKNNTSVNAKTPWTSQYVAVPRNLSFSDIDLDGTYMGWQGNAQDSTFERIRSRRYGDVQDSHGGNAGGKNKWFAPPHLFYLNYGFSGDPQLANRNIKIRDVTDEGRRAGVARDKPGDTPLSGYALSLKIGCNDCSVDGYKSSRPDGFLDLLPSDGLTISNVEATYNSAFLNNLFPGWRFPSGPYKHIILQNINLKDAAAVSVEPPIGSAGATSSEGIVLRNVHVSLNAWGGAGSLLPHFAGIDNEVSLDYRVRSGDRHVAYMQKGELQETLDTKMSGPLASVTWTSKPEATCGVTGAMDAAGGHGERDIKLNTLAGDTITLTCRTGDDVAELVMRLSETP